MVEYAEYKRGNRVLIDPNGFGESLAIESPHQPRELDPDYPGFLREARVCFNIKDSETMLDVIELLQGVGCGVSTTPVEGLVEPIVNLSTRIEGQFYTQEYCGLKQVQQVVKYISDQNSS